METTLTKTREQRLKLLAEALHAAQTERPCSDARVQRFTNALIDVRVDAVQDRTVSALDEARRYLGRRSW